jgi:hypothetical protein
LTIVQLARLRAGNGDSKVWCDCHRWLQMQYTRKYFLASLCLRGKEFFTT